MSSIEKIRQRLLQRFEEASHRLPEESAGPSGSEAGLPFMSLDVGLPSAVLEDERETIRRLEYEVDVLRQALLEAREWSIEGTSPRIHALEEETGKLRAAVEAVEAERDHARRRLDEERQRAALAVEEAAKHRGRDEDSQKKIAQLIEQLAEKDGELSAAREAALRAEDKWQRAKAEAGQTAAAAEEDLAALRRQVAERSAEAVEVQDRLARLVRDLAERQKALEDEQNLLAERDRLIQQLEQRLSESGRSADAASQKTVEALRLAQEEIQRLEGVSAGLQDQCQVLQDKIQALQTPQGPASPDRAAEEKIAALEQALRERDRRLTEQEKISQNRKMALEGLTGELRNKEERLAALESERDALAHALADRPVAAEAASEAPAPNPEAPARIQAWEEQRDQWQREKDQVQRRLTEIEAVKTQAEARCAALDADLRKALQSCDELRQKNIALEKETRLLSLSASTLEQMERTLRDVYRLVPSAHGPAVGSVPGPADRVAAGRLGGRGWLRWLTFGLLGRSRREPEKKPGGR